MAVKQDKKAIAITLSTFYRDKLDVLCQRHGVSKSEMVRILLDKHSVFDKVTFEK